MRVHRQNARMKTIHLSLPRNIARADAATGIGTRLRLRGNRLQLATLLIFLGLGAGRALASDPIGIYALVDKVVFEPNATSPERIRIWGAFAIAEGSGYTYKSAERGYLYYKVNPENPTACRSEWNDLKSVAGTGQIVAFASRYGEKGALRKKETKPGNPDVYPIAMGLTKVKEKKDYEPIQQLAKLRDSKAANPARNP